MTQRQPQGNNTAKKRMAYIVIKHINSPPSLNHWLTHSLTHSHPHLLWQCTGRPRWPGPGRSRRSCRADCWRPGRLPLWGPGGCSSSSRCKPCPPRSSTRTTQTTRQTQRASPARFIRHPQNALKREATGGPLGYYGRLNYWPKTPPIVWVNFVVSPTPNEYAWGHFLALLEIDISTPKIEWMCCHENNCLLICYQKMSRLVRSKNDDLLWILSSIDFY